MATAPAPNPPEIPDAAAGWSLPAWTYRDAEFFEVEKARILRAAWQVVAHESDIPALGDWHAIEWLGEPVIVVRGDDGAIRAMSNVCRHRGARILDGDCGHARRLVCPYHAWTYALDGALTGVPMRGSYGSDALAGLRLPRISCENWEGFIFIRLEGGGPSVAEMMAPYMAEIAPYRFRDLRRLGRVTVRPRTVNWKNVGDNYSDALHIPVAHPGLKRLMGDGYMAEEHDWVDKMTGPIVASASSNPSERAYQALLPDVPHLPAERQRLWTYFKLWPNVAFDIYPDQVDFMAWMPVSATECVIREISYAIPDDRREMRAARYLNWRINRQVNAEDTVLIARVQAGMASQSFTVGPIGRSEVCLRSFAAKIRAAIPEARLHHAPALGWGKRARGVQG